MVTYMDESQAQQQAERERQRKARFSEEENDVLINSILPHYDKLFGKLAARTSTAVKNALWREIAAAVNAISAYPRSLQNCKKRYADVKRKVKEKLCKIARHRRATGDRVPLSISFWPYERIMEKIISAEVAAGVLGATDSGRMAEPNAAGPSDVDAGSEYFPDIHNGSESARSEIEDSQLPIHHFPADKEDHGISNMEGGMPDPQKETLIVQEEPLRERRPNACRVDPSQRSRELWSTRHHHSMKDHTTLIYAEQSHFRRTMAKKLDILNNNVKALNKNVKAFQSSFNQSIVALSQSMQQQNSIFEKLSSNLLLMAQQQQQHNQLCTSAIKQLFQIFPSSRDFLSLSVPNEMPTDATSETQTLKEPCAHGLELTESRRPSSPPGEAPKRRRH